MRVLSFVLSCLLVVASVSLSPCSAALLKSGTPTSANWSKIISETSDPYYKAIYQILKGVGAPSATLAVQSNTKSNLVDQTPPSSWGPGQYWYAIGWGTGYDTTMRVASNTKPLMIGVYEQNMAALLNSPFYSLWNNNWAYMGMKLPEPKDARVKQITIQQLLDHTSGFNNTNFGFDPMFKGQTVQQQIGDLLKNYNLASAPGSMFSYSNFGFAILGTMVPALHPSHISYAQAIKNLFPSPATIPAYSADNDVQAPKEIGTYWAVSPDGTFSVEPMLGNGNLVTNAITLSWYASQYWIGGSNAGRRFSQTAGANSAWIMDGSMPGTSSASVQYINSKGKVSSGAVITNFRPKGAKGSAADTFLGDLNTAILNLLKAKFA